MSKYTTEVRFICEHGAGLNESAGLSNVTDIINQSRRSIFGDYPIFDETYRQTLETKILKHYYTREICEETVGLWKLRLNSRMNEIMPYYNKLYASELLTFNPLYDVDYSAVQNREAGTEGHTVSSNTRNDETERSTESESSNTSKSNSQSATNTSNTQKDKYSDTPQGGITGLESGTYLTNARIVDANGNGTNTFAGNDSSTDNTESSSNEKFKTAGNRSDVNKVNSTEDYLEHVSGKRGGSSYSTLLKEYRETFLNIDMKIIDELSDLFFGLW